MHQAQSVAVLLGRLPRSKFCGFLKRFWDGFIWNWDVLLHSNPAIDIFNGIKLAAGGELGIGVGEEEWGSGEREVLEGFVERTEGLVDLVVSRFGDAAPSSRDPSIRSSSNRNLQDIKPDRHSSIDYPKPSDGIVFSGVGALTRLSVRNISSWMEWLHMHGLDAYGVRDNPSSTPRRKRKKMGSSTPEFGHATKAVDAQRSGSDLSPSKYHESHKGPNGSTGGPGIPPSIVALDKTRQVASATSASGQDSTHAKDEPSDADAGSGTDTLVKYLTLGVYGSTWGIPSGRPPVDRRVSNLRRDGFSKVSTSTTSNDERKIGPASDTLGGHFLVGLQGELEEGNQAVNIGLGTEASTDAENASEGSESDNCVMIRTLHVERVKPKDVLPSKDAASDPETAAETYFDTMRLVVYVHKPFIFTFLFDLETPALALPSFYRSLHHQLGPLQRPLMASTSPSKVSERLWEAASPRSTASTASTQPICDLVFDPVRLTIHTTIPNIPEPGTEESPTQPWTRIEALSVHSQILNTYTSTRQHTSELERTCKTSRGWWVVWMRLPNASPLPKQNDTIDATDNNDDHQSFREAFLIRKASDYVTPAAARKSSGRFGRDVSGSSASASASGAWGGGPGKLAEGIGIDARQYIEGLLSLNR
jgi:hypothetical protein